MVRFTGNIKTKHLIFTAALLILIITILAISNIFAFYTHTQEIENNMQTAMSEVALNEIFNEKDQWVAGETKQKEVCFENMGEIDQFIRFTVIEKWLEQDASNNWVEWEEAGTEAAAIGYTSALGSEWTQIGAYYYYNNILEPNTKTNIVMDTIEFSDELDNGGYGSSLDYSDKKYSLTIKMEAVEANTDVAHATWNVSCTMDYSTKKATWSEIQEN